MTLKRLKTEFSKETQSWSDQYRRLHVDTVIPVMDLDERIRILEERMLIIHPPVGQFSKYPALAEAYNEYKLIEKLILNNET